MDKKIALSMRGVTKRFGSVVANHQVNLDVYKGEILAILGENGCGKTTLMNMIAGIYFPDEGKIFKDDQEVIIRSPKDAFALKIGKQMRIMDQGSDGINIPGVLFSDQLLHTADGAFHAEAKAGALSYGNFHWT